MRTLIFFDLDDVVVDTHGTGRAYPDASEVVPLLSRSCRLALVTCGSEDVQREKLRKSAIAYCFSHLVIVDDPHKKLSKIVSLAALYPEIIPEDMIIVDNRVDQMIPAANSLGYVSVWLRRGKYMNHVPSGSQKPTYTMASLHEFVEVMKERGKL